MSACLLLSAALATTATTTAEASEPPTLNTDRPGFADGVQAMAPGHLNFELGLRLAPDSENGFALANPWVRFGVLDWLELRLSLPLVEGTFGPGGDFGVRDLGTGVKLAFAPAERFAFSVVPMVFFPTGSDGFSQEEVTAFVGVNAQQQLGGGFYMTAAVTNGTVTRLLDGERKQRHVFGASLELGAQVLPRLGTYVQGFTARVDAPGESWLPFLGAGATYLIGRRLQLDASFDIGLSDASLNGSSFAVGVSVLF